MKSQAKCYEDLYTYCETVPLVDCHDHATKLGPKYTDPIQVVIGEYFLTDLGSASYPDGLKPLDDYLFHAFMHMAHELDLPVQLHTGHLAGFYGDIRQANAAALANFLLLHRDVRFDLFHANWPYSGEILFLAKAYPNVTLDFCWTNAIDPIYCQNLFRQALSSVPHSKIHGYGADFGGHGFHPGGGTSIAPGPKPRWPARTSPSPWQIWSRATI